MRHAIILTFLIAWAASGAWAKQYYVHPDGDDRHPGDSHATAWRTLSHAISRVGPGDTVYVGAGRYQGQLYMNRFAGTEAAPIRFIADTTGKDLRNDGGVVELVNGSGLLYMKDSHHVHFIGFQMRTNSGTLLFNDGSDGVVFEDCTIMAGGGALHANGADGFVVRGCDITANGHGVYAAGATVTLTDTTIRVTNTSNSPLHGANNSTLSADRVTLIGGGHVVYVSGGRLTLTNAVLAGGSRTGIHGAHSPGVTLVQCTMHGLGEDGIYATGGRWIIRNTIISNPGRYAFFRANNAAFHESHGLYHGWGQALAYGFTPTDPLLDDPRFVNAGDADFRLAAGSPAIDAGADMSAYTTVDRLGHARPGGSGWDIGAYEDAGLSKTIYVRTSGSDTHSGRTPARAYRTIQRAIQEATGPGYTIYVGPGVYAQALVIGTGAGAAAASGTASQPNRLIADSAGVETGDRPGPVIISGNNRSIALGMLVSGRSHWHAEGFHFTGHGTTAVQVRNGGMTLAGCTIDVPPSYGVLMQGNAPMAVDGNVFNFADDSGHTVVMELRNGGNSTLRIENNRMHNDGIKYLATSYKDRLPSTFSQAHTWRYGIYANGQNNPTGSVIIRNNIISDKYVGLYGISNSSGPLIIANNTITGCSWPVYTVGGPSGSVIANNIIASSYYGVMTNEEAPVIALCEFDITISMHTFRRQNFHGDIITSNPRFADAPAGNFALIAGSECIDAGTEIGAPSEDIAGNPRPTDGNNDGLAKHDLGAMEQVVRRERMRVVSWQEVSPLGED